MIKINGFFKGVVTSDEHSPFHDPLAIKLANKIIQWWDPNIVLLNGDQLDCYDLSTFSKDPELTKGFQREIDIWHKEILIPQKNAAPNAKFYKIDGNHEERYNRYISKLGGLTELRSVRLENALELSRFDIGHAPDGMILNDSLFVSHGEVAKKWSGSSGLQVLEDTRYRYNVIIGHTHRAGRAPVRVGDSMIIAQENPCLCSLEPGYINTPDWMQGITLFNCTPEYTFIQPVTFNNYKAYVGNVLFTL